MDFAHSLVKMISVDAVSNGLGRRVTFDGGGMDLNILRLLQYMGELRGIECCEMIFNT